MHDDLDEDVVRIGFQSNLQERECRIEVEEMLNAGANPEQVLEEVRSGGQYNLLDLDEIQGIINSLVYPQE